MRMGEEEARRVKRRRLVAVKSALAPLSMLYAALRGDEWSVKAKSRWLRTSDASTWDGVEIEHGEVVCLHLTSRGREGGLELPKGWGEGFARLTQLRELDMSGERLRGML